MEEKGRIDLDLPPKIEGETTRSREEERVYFLDLLIVLAKHKKFIAWFVFAAVAVSVSISLLLSPSFTASTRILPPQQDQSTASALLGQLNPLMNLAGASGLGRNTSDRRPSPNSMPGRKELSPFPSRTGTQSALLTLPMGT